MNDALCVGALYAVGVNMGHDVVAHELFSLLRDFIVDIVGMCLKLIDLLLRYGQSELLFRLGKRDPELSPCSELLVGRKDIFHFLARIACGQG